MAAASGRLVAECRKSDGAVIASELCSSYPLRLHVTTDQNARCRRREKDKQKKKALSCYLLGYGGGLVSGDRIDLELHVKSGASLVVTSQSTTKAFRARPDRPPTRTSTTARVDNDGLLVWVPQPTQCFQNSRLQQTTHVTMKPGASLLLLDWYTGGRLHLDNGGWQMDSLEAVTTISYSPADGGGGAARTFFRDASLLAGGGMHLKRHMRHFQVVVMAVFVGPCLRHVAKSLLQKFSSRHSYAVVEDSTRGGEGLNDQDGLIISCGTFPTMEEHEPQGVLLRMASVSVERAALFLSEHIGTLHGQLEHDPFMEILVSRCGAPALKEDKNYQSQPVVVDRKLSLDLMMHSVTNSVCNHQNGIHHSVVVGPKNSVRPSTLFQLVDSSTPTGGFAHSNTLEAAFQLQIIDSNSLMEYTWDVLLQTMTSLVPFLVETCNLFQPLARTVSEDFNNDDAEKKMEAIITEWSKLDRELSINTTSQVAHRASCSQGSGTLRAFSQTFPHIAVVLKRIKKRSLQQSGGHAVTCFGAVCGLVGVDAKQCASMFLYTTARDMINAAVRLNMVGPLEGGRLINDLCRRLDDILEQHMSHSVDSGYKWASSDAVHQVAPLVEILANAHDRLYTRLFNS